MWFLFVCTLRSGKVLQYSRTLLLQFIPNDYDQNVQSHVNFQRANVFFSRIIGSFIVNFCLFLCLIFMVLRKGKSGKYVLAGFGLTQYIFSRCVNPFLGVMRGRPGECMLWRGVAPSMNILAGCKRQAGSLVDSVTPVPLLGVIWCLGANSGEGPWTTIPSSRVSSCYLQNDSLLLPTSWQEGARVGLAQTGWMLARSTSQQWQTWKAGSVAEPTALSVTRGFCCVS